VLIVVNLWHLSFGGIDAAGRLCVPELLWRLYFSSGSRCFNRLKGVFSLIVADLSSRRFYLYRSPLLGKSLYYFLNREIFIAASEAHGVLRHPAVAGALDDSWLARFFTLASPPTSATPFRSVTELLPGELLSISSIDHQITRQPPAIGQKRIRFTSEQEYVEQFDELVPYRANCQRDWKALE
jgi:asparagine synthase (glutamine-hydrolysing)